MIFASGSPPLFPFTGQAKDRIRVCGSQLMLPPQNWDAYPPCALSGLGRGVT